MFDLFKNDLQLISIGDTIGSEDCFDENCGNIITDENYPARTAIVTV